VEILHMQNAKLYLLVAGLTAANIGFRFLPSDGRKEGLPVSHLELGERVESVELEQLFAAIEIDPLQCRMIVAFNPDCPFCEQAARREHFASRSGAYAEPLWLTDEERPRLPSFAESLSPGSRHAVAPEAFEALDVEAVPALFLLDEEWTVEWVGAYRGDESAEVLAARCEGKTLLTAAAEPTPSTSLVGQ
jgi:hypothetical protein